MYAQLHTFHWDIYVFRTISRCSKISINIASSISYYFSHFLITVELLPIEMIAMTAIWNVYIAHQQQYANSCWGVLSVFGACNFCHNKSADNEVTSRSLSDLGLLSVSFRYESIHLKDDIQNFDWTKIKYRMNSTHLMSIIREEN